MRAAQEEREDEGKLTRTELDRNQRLTIAEEGLSSASAGFTANFVTPFAIAVGAASTTIALLSSLPALIAAFAQLGVQHARMLFPTRRKYMFWLSLLQGVLWLPLLAIPYLPNPGAWLVAFVTLNTIAGFLVNPVLSTFIADIVPDDGRGRFFGMRNMVNGMCGFVATAAAGMLLTAFRPHPLVGFAFLFALAFVLRALSALLFRIMSAPAEGKADNAFPEPHRLLLDAQKTPFGMFTLFLMLFYVACNIASPFFAVYQLSVLGWSYVQFTILACTGMVAGFLTMLLWGKYVDKIGSRNVLLACGLCTPIIPLAWSLTNSFTTLLAVEALSGVVWAGFDLSAGTYVFDATDPGSRTRRIAEHTVLVRVAVFAGALIGGMMVGRAPLDATAYTDVFFLSAALRFVAILAFVHIIREQRLIEIPVRGRIFRNVIFIRPQQGLSGDVAIETRTPHAAVRAPRAHP